jgi:hypothetical protein
MASRAYTHHLTWVVNSGHCEFENMVGLCEWNFASLDKGRRKRPVSIRPYYLLGRTRSPKKLKELNMYYVYEKWRARGQ